MLAVSIPVNRGKYHQLCYMYLPHTPLHMSLCTALRSGHCHTLRTMDKLASIIL